MQITCLKIYYALLSWAKYFLFLIKVVCVYVYVTYYMKYVLGYGIFTKKNEKRRTTFEFSRVVNRWGDSSGMGETVQSRRERKLLFLLYAK